MQAGKSNAADWMKPTGSLMQQLALLHALACAPRGNRRQKALPSANGIACISATLPFFGAFCPKWIASGRTGDPEGLYHPGGLHSVNSEVWDVGVGSSGGDRSHNANPVH
jgi:hypothetical protein